MVSKTISEEPSPEASVAETVGRGELELQHVELTYERVFKVLHGVNLRVPAAGIVGLLGSNGAGKTSTLRAVTGFLRSERAAVTAGHITYRGESLVGRAPHRVARQGVVLVPEREKVFVSMTVRDNLEVARAGAKGRQTWAELLDMIYGYFPILHERSSQKAGYLSGGERQMLGLARALVREPTLLMVDELSLGLAPKIIEDLTVIVKRINEEQGTSILFVEQNAHAAFEIAEHLYIMESGRILLDGAPDDLRGRTDVQELYLGMGGQDERSYSKVRPHTKAARWWG